MDKFKGQHEDGDGIITKMRLIREVNNDMCHNFYYEVRFRIYTGKTHYYKGNFVIWFDTDDLAMEYPEKDIYTKADIRNYANELAWGFMDLAPRKNINAETLRPFYEECSRTIDNYNGNRRYVA